MAESLAHDTDGGSRPTFQFVLVGSIPYLRTVAGDAAFARLEAAHPRVRVRVVEDADSFAALLPEADGVIVWPSYSIPSSFLRPDGRLRWVQSMPAGVDSLLTPDLAAARHVTLTSSKGPMGPAMAEHAVLLMLALARDLSGFVVDQQAKRWSRGGRELGMTQLLGKTVAILGVGAVGHNLARICKQGFRMRVLGLARTRLDDPSVDRYIARSELHSALAEADFVALCLAHTPATDRIVDAAALASMKPAAFLVNVARGKLVDEEALVEALRNREIAGAGLDATAVEPLPTDSPLWTMPNVIITPHVAPARDPLTSVAMVDFWVENIRRFAEGQPLLGLVDREEGY